jgi:anti-sigma B factor antagonist
MTIENVPSGTAFVLKLSGEVDLHASPALRAELLACIAAKTPLLLLDFSAVDYIDSSGLATLIEYLKESASFDGKFALVGLQKKVLAVLELVRLDQLFVLASDAPTALAKLGAK